MPDIPDSLLRRSAEAKAKALGVPVEEVLAEMTGEGPPVDVPPVAEPVEPDTPVETSDRPEPPEGEVTVGEGADSIPVDPGADIVMSTAEPESVGAEVPDEASAVEVPIEGQAQAPAGSEQMVDDAPAAEASMPASPDSDTLEGNGEGPVAAVVTPRPIEPPVGAPSGVRTQRLLTVVKARAIQQVKAEPTDKVTTWPHLMIAEFAALLAMTGFLMIISTILQAPLLEAANENLTPNPSKAPWYFLGLQELLAYFDPQIAGVLVPTLIGLVGFMFIPYIDRNPSTRPSDRKLAIMMFTFFLAGSATLTMIGVLFRGKGFNFSYPWRDGVFFDDLKDWINFE